VWSRSLSLFTTASLACPLSRRKAASAVHHARPVGTRSGRPSTRTTLRGAAGSGRALLLDPFEPATRTRAARHPFTIYRVFSGPSANERAVLGATTRFHQRVARFVHRGQWLPSPTFPRTGNARAERTALGDENMHHPEHFVNPRRARPASVARLGAHRRAARTSPPMVNSPPQAAISTCVSMTRGTGARSRA